MWGGGGDIHPPPPPHTHTKEEGEGGRPTVMVSTFLLENRISPRPLFSVI